MADKKIYSHPASRLILSVAILCIVSLVLLISRVVVSDSTRYVFLVWNLVLAAAPLLIAIWLVSRIQLFGWLRWQQAVLTALFIGFLPNSFYLITDIVHLRSTYEVSLIYDVILLVSFMLSGLVLGYLAVFMVHRELQKRLSENAALLAVGLIFLAAGFAIYMGRFTRWSTWDLILQPAGLLFDVSDRFVNPTVHADTFVTSGMLFLLLASLYWVIYESFRLARHL